MQPYKYELYASKTSAGKPKKAQPVKLRSSIKIGTVVVIVAGANASLVSVLLLFAACRAVLIMSFSLIFDVFHYSALSL